MKRCCKCKDDLPLGAFKKNASRKDGLQSQCIECQKKYRTQHYLANKKKYLDKASLRRKAFQEWWKHYKSQLKCTCGECHPACLQFHHTDETKEHCVSALIASASIARLEKELKKCIVVCANCHFKIHWRESDGDFLEHLSRAQVGSRNSDLKQKLY